VGGIGGLIGGLLFGAVIPFTLIVIFPTAGLISVRSAASLVAFVLFLLLRPDDQGQPLTLRKE
jgi:hypothetical protein